MKQLLFACLVFVGCNTPEPTQTNTPLGMSHLLDTTTGTNSIALGKSAYDKPIVSKQDLKKLSVEKDPADYVEDSEFYNYSSSIALVESEDSQSIRFAGNSGIISNELGISNRYFLDTVVIEKPVIKIVDDTIKHLEIYPAQVTYVNRYYVRGYYYNYDTSLQYQSVDTSLVSSRVILVDGLIKPSNLFIVE